MKAYLLLLIPFFILASCKKYTEVGSTFQADQKLLKTWLYSEKLRSTLDNWETYVLSEIIKLTDTDLWIRTQFIDNGIASGQPDLEKHTAL